MSESKILYKDCLPDYGIDAGLSFVPQPRNGFIPVRKETQPLEYICIDMANIEAEGYLNRLS